MTNEMPLGVRLYLEAQRFTSGFQRPAAAVKGFSAGVKRELSALRGAFRSVEGRIASLGVTVGATAAIMQSARMDKSLIQLGQTAEVGRDHVVGLRKELFALGKQTGQNVDDLLAGQNTLIQSGASWKSSLEILKATSVAMAVTSARAEVLASALTVADTTFQFDLERPGQALKLLDQMTVAGRLGNAELEDLSAIFGRVGPTAQGAGMAFEQTLAFIEGLSMIERRPERLATLADSTLRLFTNAQYMSQVSRATRGRVKFFDTDGARRDALEVLADLKKEYDKFDSDLGRQRFLARAFQGVDLDTLRGLRVLLSGDSLAMINRFASEIASSGGVLEKDLEAALDNSVDQVGRLKAALRETADDFSQHINAGISKAIKFAMDDREKGGLGLSGGQMIAGGVVAGLGLFAAGRYGGPLLKKALGVGGGVATGKALEKAAGVTPVYVVNMPDGGFGGGVGVGNMLGARGRWAPKLFSTVRANAALLGGMRLSQLGLLGVRGLAMATGAVGAAGAAAYGLGWLANKYLLTDKGPLGSETGQRIGETIGRTVAQVLAFFGKDTAREALEAESRAAAQVEGTIRVQIDSEGRPRVQEVRSSRSNVDLEVDAGYVWGGA